MSILDNFLEDQLLDIEYEEYLYHKQQRANHEYQAWCNFVEQKEEEEKAYDIMCRMEWEQQQRHMKEVEDHMDLMKELISFEY